MKHTFRSLIHGYRRYARLSRNEWIHIIIMSIVFGFIFAYRIDEIETFSLGIWAYYFILYTIISLLGFLSFHVPMRLAAYKMGYIPSYKPWTFGLILGFAITVLTSGFPVPLSGGIEYKTETQHRFGRFKIGPQYKELGYLVFWGFVGVVIYSLFFKIILPDKLALDMVGIALLITLWSLIPFNFLLPVFSTIWSILPFDFEFLTNPKMPITNGTYLFLGLLHFSVFALVFFALAMLSIFYLGTISAVLISFFLAVIVFLIYYIFLMPKGKRLWT